MATPLSLAQEIIQNGVDAASANPRLALIRLDVLPVPEKIISDALYDPKRSGVIVRTDQCGGMLLSDISPDTSTAQQLARTRRTATIRPDTPVDFYHVDVMCYH